MFHVGHLIPCWIIFNQNATAVILLCLRLCRNSEALQPDVPFKAVQLSQLIALARVTHLASSLCLKMGLSTPVQTTYRHLIPHPKGTKDMQCTMEQLKLFTVALLYYAGELHIVYEDFSPTVCGFFLFLKSSNSKCCSTRDWSWSCLRIKRVLTLSCLGLRHSPLGISNWDRNRFIC